jgi:uncharacterized protein (TIGR00730 family)
MKRIAVFCGSSPGTNSQYKSDAEGVGRFLASQGIDLVYGGAKVGLMGAVARGVLSGGGQVTGIIPGFLRIKEVVDENLTELIVVDTMHQRKAKQYELCDGVMVLPGGFGTMDELFEILTWGQLGLHKKPVGILNMYGYYNGLIQVIDHMVGEGFLKQVNRDMVIINESVQDLIETMKNYRAPGDTKWIPDLDLI